MRMVWASATPRPSSTNPVTEGPGRGQAGQARPVPYTDQVVHRLGLGMPSEEECEHDMLVTIRWKSRELAVPLMQLEGINVDEETQQAIEDWHYWVDQGYEL